MFNMWQTLAQSKLWQHKEVVHESFIKDIFVVNVDLHTVNYKHNASFERRNFDRQ